MKSRSGFTLIEIMIVLVVISIIVSITVVGYNAQIREAHDNKSAINAVNLADSLNKYYSQKGSMPITCGHSAHAELSCTKVDDAYTSSMTQPPKITANMTLDQVRAILPGLNEAFSHPRNPNAAPINRTVSNIIQTDSYFLLSMDIVPGGTDEPIDSGGGGTITPPPSTCPPNSICPPTTIYNSGEIQLAKSSDQAVLGVTTTITTSNVTFANPKGGSFQCSFAMTGQNPKGSQDRRPHQFIIGFVNEESNAWKFYAQEPSDDLNVLNWNNTSSANCNSESISALKSS